MNASIPQIFLSYSRANKDIADAIDNDFKSIGISFQRDVRDIAYRGSIKDFMNRIGKMDFVLMILSDEYLRSEYCMYEVTELLNTHEFAKRILPIVHDDATGIFKADTRLVYYTYWKEQIKAAKKRLQQFLNADHMDQLKRCTNINEHLDVFFLQINDLNVFGFSALKEQNYKPMIDIIGWDEGAILEEAISIHNIKENEERDLVLEDFENKYGNNKYVLFIQAYYEKKQGEYKKARRHYEELIKTYPKYELAYNNLGIILRSDYSEYKEAEKKYNKAIEINPMYFEAHVNLAILLHEDILAFKKAKDHYYLAIKINPQDEVMHYNLAVLLKTHFSDYDGAKEHYMTAIKVNPQLANAHYNLANLLMNYFMNFKEAREHYLVATDIDSGLINPGIDKIFNISR